MGKGSNRRPGKGFEENYEKIFGNKKPCTSRTVVRDGKLVQATEVEPGSKIFIVSDIEPFKSPITGEIITSRSHLRLHHKEHGTTDMRDYSPEFMEKKQRERHERMMGMTKHDHHDRIQALREAVHKHRR